MREPICVELDDDQVDQHDELVRKAVEHVRRIAGTEPDTAAKGFCVAVTDEQDRMLFRVVFGSGESAKTIN